MARVARELQGSNAPVEFVVNVGDNVRHHTHAWIYTRIKRACMHAHTASGFPFASRHAHVQFYPAGVNGTDDEVWDTEFGDIYSHVKGAPDALPWYVQHPS